MNRFTLFALVHAAADKIKSPSAVADEIWASLSRQGEGDVVAALEEISVRPSEFDDDPARICEHCVREFDVCDADAKHVPGESRCPGGIARRTLARLRASTSNPAPAPTGMEPGQRCVLSAGWHAVHEFSETIARYWVGLDQSGRCPYVEPRPTPQRRTP